MPPRHDPGGPGIDLSLPQMGTQSPTELGPASPLEDSYRSIARDVSTFVLEGLQGDVSKKEMRGDVLDKNVVGNKEAYDSEAQTSSADDQDDKQSKMKTGGVIERENVNKHEVKRVKGGQKKGSTVRLGDDKNNRQTRSMTKSKTALANHRARRWAPASNPVF